MPVHTCSSPPSSRPLYPAPYLRPPSQSSSPPSRRRRPSITTTQPRKKRKNIPSDVDIAEIRRKSDTRWKEQDLFYLSQALAAGHSYESIARHLVRSIASVHVRATRLRKAQKAIMAKQEPDTEQPVRTRKTGRPTTSTHHEEPDTSDSASSSSTSTSTSASPVALIESSITQQLQHPQVTRPLWAATNAPYFHEAHRILPTSGDEDYIHHLKQKRLLEQQRGLYNTATFMNAWQHTFPQPYDAHAAAAAQIQTLAAQTSYLQQQQHHHHHQQQQYQAMSSSSSTSASPSISPPPETSDIGLNVPSHVTMITINNSNSILTNGSTPFVTTSLPAYDYSQVTDGNNNNYHQHEHITSATLPQATCTTPALPQFPFHYAQQQAHAQAQAQAQAQAFAAQHQSLLAQYQQAISNGSLPGNEHISIGPPVFQTPDFNFLQHAMPPTT